MAQATLDQHAKDTLRQTSEYLEIMVSRTQRELLGLPGVWGIEIMAKDTVERLELYSQSVDMTTNKYTTTANKSKKESKKESGKPGHGSEFNFECGEISGTVTIIWLAPQSPDYHDDRHEVSPGSGEENFGEYSVRHREETSFMLAALVKALARRIFELHRGHHNKKLMIAQARSLSRIKAELIERTQQQMSTESRKSVLETVTNDMRNQVDALNAQLKVEQQINIEAIVSNKQLTERSLKITAGVRSEYAKELGAIKDEFSRREQNHRDELGRREAVINYMREQHVHDHELVLTNANNAKRAQMSSDPDSSSTHGYGIEKIEKVEKVEKDDVNVNAKTEKKEEKKDKDKKDKKKEKEKKEKKEKK